MKKLIALFVAALVASTLIAVPVGAAVRVGFTSATVFGVEYEPAADAAHDWIQDVPNVAIGLGLVQKKAKNGAAFGVTKYFGDFQRHTNRPFVAARLGWVGDGGGLTYAAVGGYSLSMGPLQLLPNINYTDGAYGIGMGAALQF